MHAVVRISRPILGGRAAGLHQASAQLLRRANARGVGKTDVQASGSPSAAVWRLAERLLSKYHEQLDPKQGRTCQDRIRTATCCDGHILAVGVSEPREPTLQSQTNIVFG